MRNVQQSYREPGLGSCFKFEKLEFVQNEKLSKEVCVKMLVLILVWAGMRIVHGVDIIPNLRQILISILIAIYHQLQEKKLAMRNEQRNVKELEEKLAFLYTTDRVEVHTCSYWCLPRFTVIIFRFRKRNRQVHVLNKAFFFFTCKFVFLPLENTTLCPVF